jgi:hypothetical protein
VFSTDELLLIDIKKKTYYSYGLHMCSGLLRDVAADILMHLEGNNRIQHFTSDGNRKSVAEGY